MKRLVVNSELCIGCRSCEEVCSKTYRINHVIIPEEEFATTLIDDGDDVQALHIFGGG